MRTINWMAAGLLLLAVALPVRAGMSTTPLQLGLELEPGASTRFSYTISDEFAVIPFVRVEPDLLSAWLRPDIAINGTEYPFGSDLTVNVDLSVPADAESGRYAGTIIAMPQSGAHRYREIPVVALTIDVIAPCDAPARFIEDNGGSLELWVPNRSVHGVELFGTLEIGDGCTLLDARYTVDDEYDVWDAEGELTIDPATGSWSATPLVEASRRGKDRDGRSYTVTLIVTTEAGASRLVREIVVPHDQRPDR